MKKIQHTLILKACKTKNETKFLNLLKDTYEKLTGDIKISGDRQKAYALKQRKIHLT